MKQLCFIKGSLLRSIFALSYALCYLPVDSLAQSDTHGHYVLFSMKVVEGWQKEVFPEEGRIYSYHAGDNSRVLITARINAGGQVEYNIPDTLIIEALSSLKLKYRIFPSADMKFLYVKPVAARQARKLDIESFSGTKMRTQYEPRTETYKMSMAGRKDGYKVWISDAEGNVYYNFQL